MALRNGATMRKMVWRTKSDAYLCVAGFHMSSGEGGSHHAHRLCPRRQ